MYTQFFGNYLLSRSYITNEQLFKAFSEKDDKHTKLGTLAIHSGLMTAAEVDSVIIEQTHQNKRFGELAIEMGYINNEQVNNLLSVQSPDFLLLGQILLDDGVIDNTTLEKIINDYRKENEISDSDMITENQEGMKKLFSNFFKANNSDASVSELDKMYLELLFNSFIRFIGDDFTPLSVKRTTEYNADCIVKQDVVGQFSLSSYIAMDKDCAVVFASRYVKEEFTEYDEYVSASLEDFLNLNNGLFAVNCSNEKALELKLTAPQHFDATTVEFDEAVVIEILYPFGKVYFLVES